MDVWQCLPVVEAQSVAFLQEYAKTKVPTNRDEDDEVEYRMIERSALLLQRLHDQMDAKMFLKHARDLTGRVDLARSDGRRVSYQIGFMVKVMCMADLLRNKSTLGDALEQSLQLLMPDILKQAFLTLWQESQRCIPHASTISRWRLLLDGAFMLQQRRANSGPANFSTCFT